MIIIKIMIIDRQLLCEVQRFSEFAVCTFGRSALCLSGGGRASLLLLVVRSSVVVVVVVAAVAVVVVVVVDTDNTIR